MTLKVMEQEGYEGEEMILQEDDNHNYPVTSLKGAAAAAAAAATTPPALQNGKKQTIENAIAAATQLKQDGNSHHAMQEYQGAADSYQQGLATLAPFLASDIHNSCKDLHINLRSNLAIAFLKLNAFEKAEHQCTVILKDLDDAVPKVWYRRALAREHLAANTTKDKSKSQEYLQLAAADLQHSLQILHQGGKDPQSRKSVVHALERIEKKMKRGKQQQQQKSEIETETTTKKQDTIRPTMDVSPPSSPQTAVNGSANANGHHSHHTEPDPSVVATTNSSMMEMESSNNQHGETVVPDIVRPEPSQQRQDVMRLLIARSVGLQRASTPEHPAVGEALFLMDWNWWSQWCRHVDFYHTSEGEDKAERILKLLPPGAILPPPSKHGGKDDNNANDDESSSDSTESENLPDDLPPGMIDNTSLMLPSKQELNPSTYNHNSQTQPTFYQQWYRHFQPSETPPPDTTSDNSNDDPNAVTVRLRPNLVRGYHYELLPREVYCALRSWYREKTPSICRRTKLFNSDLDESDQNEKMRPVVTLLLYPISNAKSLASSIGLKQSMPRCAACRAQDASKRCTRCQSVCYCDRGCQESHWPFHKPICSKIAAGKEDSDLYLADGRVGLHQLGNTCFMNAAIQCLSHATPLTRHFLSNQFKIDLNSSNPLGTGGKLAQAYETVLKEIWMKPNITSTTPTALKRAIALFAPRFAGCLQHDSQEFLAYLLDGLHEDLNRIKKPPYVEMPDADNHGANMAVAGAEAWECHMLRNDSLVMDTFYGQFKSTCVCPNPNCGRVSVSFDAFNHVSLEIPQMQNATIWVRILVFYNPPVTNHQSSKNPKNRPRTMRYAICVRRGSLITDLREALSQVCGIPTTHLVLCEMSDNIIVKILNNNEPVTSIREGDTITAYQVDPYTKSSIHVVASHALVEPGIKTGEAGEQAPKFHPDFRQQFGFPFMTSCDANLTCRQLMDDLWRQIRRFVVPLNENGEEEDIDPALEEVYRQLYSVRATDAEGNPESVFPTPADGTGKERAEDTDAMETSQLSSYVPCDVDEKISKFLGEDCTTKFLFLRLDWKESLVVPDELLNKNASQSSSNTGGNNKKKKKTKKNNSKVKEIPRVIKIEEPMFLAFSDHPSFIEGQRKQRASNASKGVTLDQCFETFTKPERLDEHNMWYCSKCKEHVRALKTMALWRLPNVLVVHLKRFEFRNSFRRDKLNTFVDFPLEGLDMSQHCAKWSNENDDACIPEQFRIDDNVPAVYDLFGVVNHYGRMGYGHYTAFARKWDEEELSKDWALFDDSSVRSVGDGLGGTSGVDSVASPAAYVLFYRRRAFN